MRKSEHGPAGHARRTERPLPTVAPTESAFHPSRTFDRTCNRRAAIDPLRTFPSRGPLAWADMTRDELLALVADAFGQEPQPAIGGVLFCHSPHVAKFAYLARVYHPAPPDQVRAWATAHDQENPYLSFLTKVGNGLRVANVNLFGVIAQIDRSGRGAGQAISLEFFNTIGGKRTLSIRCRYTLRAGLVSWHDSNRSALRRHRQAKVRCSSWWGMPSIEGTKVGGH